MLFVSIVHHYFVWHYGQAFQEILHVWKNFFWFTIHFFSLPQLLKAFFSPYRRITEERGATFNFEALAGFIIINLISRIIGMIMRSLVIIFGVVALFILLIGIIFTYITWTLAPLLLVGSLYYGIRLLFI